MSLTFTDVLTRFASQANVSLNETTGLPEPSRQEEHRFTLYLNEAAAWIWRGLFKSWTLPDILTGDTVTLGTGGIIAATDVDSSTFYTVWESDPRLELPEDRHRLQKRASQKENGDIVVESGTSGDEVYVIYRTRIPKWTAVEATTAATVSIGTLLWDKTCGDCGSGNVYRALVADASPDDFTDTSLWTPVTLPDTLLEPLTAKAMAIKLRTDGQPAIAATWEETAIEWMHSRSRESEVNPGEKPWLYNSNS